MNSCDQGQGRDGFPRVLFAVPFSKASFQTLSPALRNRKNVSQRQHIDRLPHACALCRDQTCNPGMYPCLEWNLQLFGGQATTLTTKPQRPGPPSLSRPA